MMKQIVFVVLLFLLYPASGESNFNYFRDIKKFFENSDNRSLVVGSLVFASIVACAFEELAAKENIELAVKESGEKASFRNVFCCQQYFVNYYLKISKDYNNSLKKYRNYKWCALTGFLKRPKCYFELDREALASVF